MSSVRFTVTKAEDNPIGDGKEAPNYGSHELQAPAAVRVEGAERSNGNPLFTNFPLWST